MALLIQTGVTLFGNNIENLYLRLDINFLLDGMSVYVKPHLYFSKENYKKDYYINEIKTIFLEDKIFTYNSATDGDLVLFAHNKYLEYLVNMFISKNLVNGVDITILADAIDVVDL
jgi:hypothetical protein